MSQESKPLNYSDHGSGDAATNQTSDALRALGQATAQTHSDWWLQAQISNYGAEQARPPSGPTTADSRPNAFSTAFQAQAAAYEAAVAASAAPTASPLGILARFTSANSSISPSGNLSLQPGAKSSTVLRCCRELARGLGLVALGVAVGWTGATIARSSVRISWSDK